MFLASLQWLLNEAPGHALARRIRLRPGGALHPGLRMRACIGALSVAHPFVHLRRFRNRGFALGCGLSFVLGFGLYGSVYLLALFLGLVRGHAPLVIGEIMVVSGAAQLMTAPVAAWAETRVDARLLTAFGFALFGVGLIANGFTTLTSDFDALFWPQVMRGAGGDVLPSAGDAAGAGILAAARGGGSQRPVQPDAQSGRRHRHRR